MGNYLILLATYSGLNDARCDTFQLQPLWLMSNFHYNSSAPPECHRAMYYNTYVVKARHLMHNCTYYLYIRRGEKKITCCASSIHVTTGYSHLPDTEAHRVPTQFQDSRI